MATKKKLFEEQFKKSQDPLVKKLEEPQSQNPPKETAPNPTPNIDKVYTSNKTGQPSGFEYKGNTYLGAKPQEIAQTQANLEARNQPIKNLLDINTPQPQPLGPLTPEQELAAQQAAAQNVSLNSLGIPSNIDIGEAVTAGLAQGAIGAAGGAIVGAPAAGVGAIAGAALGGASLFIKGVYSNIKEQQQGLIQADIKSVTSANTQLNNLVSAVNNGADTGVTDLEYQRVISSVYQQQQEIKIQTKGKVGKALEDGTKQLEQFEIFFSLTEPTIRLKYNQAKVNPIAGKMEASTIEDYMDSLPA